jgi:hypothetical protein
MRIKAGFTTLVFAAITYSGLAQSKTIIFQQGLNNYIGCMDRELRNPETNYGTGPKDDSLLVSEH